MMKKFRDKLRLPSKTWSILMPILMVVAFALVIGALVLILMGFHAGWDQAHVGETMPAIEGWQVGLGFGFIALAIIDFVYLFLSMPKEGIKKIEVVKQEPEPKKPEVKK